MIEFSFKLNDVDASNLIGVLHDAKVAALDKENEYRAACVSNPQDKVALVNANWYKEHAKYLEELKQKVLAGNKRG